MNWTSRQPFEKTKCIVETNIGSTFPAYYSNGFWWHADKRFIIEGVTRWIIYPEGEEPNDYIAPEVLLKYAMQSYRESQKQLKATRDLNQQLCKEFGTIKKQYDKAKSENETFKVELTQTRKQARKARTLYKNISRLLADSHSLLHSSDMETDAGE